MRHALLQRFATIYWRLTGTYILSSLLLTIVFTVLLLMAGSWYYSRKLPALYAEEVMFGVSVADLHSAFEASDQRPEAFGSKLLTLFPCYHPFNEQQQQYCGATADSELIAQGRPDWLIALLDADGHVITSTQPLTYPTGLDLSSVEPSAGRQVIANALQGITDTTQLGVWSQRDREVVVAAPVIERTGQVAGVVYTRDAEQTVNSVVLSVAKLILPWTLTPWVVVSGLVALLSAWFASRGLNQRLKQLAQTSAAFAHGDLSQRIADPHRDEVGQLALQFNTMADQLANNLLALRQLADQNALLAKQAAQLATIEERNRLARDLHDSVKQQVFAASMNLAAVQELWGGDDLHGANPLIRTAAVSVEQAKRNLTAIIPALRPVELERDGIEEAIRHHVQVWEQQTGISTSCQINISMTAMPVDVEQAVFRIIQEGLANVARHSRAQMVSCSLDVHGGTLLLRICDDGVGFDVRAVPEGLGLHSMRERAQAIGGKLTVSSSSTGTELVIEVSLAEEFTDVERVHSL